MPRAPSQRPTGVAPVTEVRATLLVTSLQMLRERALIDRWSALVDPAMRDAIAGVVAATWVPIEYMVAHYRACDQLGFTVPEMIDVGKRLTSRVHRPIFDVLVRLAGTAGMTPWNVADQLPKIWERMFRGGAIGTTRLGPKEAKITIRGFPCAPIAYSRIGWRGVLLGGVELFSQRSFVNEIPKECDATTLAYRVSWV